MVAHYLWNIALSEALYPSLQSLEVALRNSIHTALIQRFGSEEWYDHSDYLEFKQRHAILDAKIAITTVKKDTEITPGRVVAQLSFGFWTTIMSRKYFTTFWEPNNFALVDAVFPNVPEWARNRKFIYERFDEIRKLRNRIFHFEPIWNRPSLARDHEKILEALGWISPAMQAVLAICNRFPEVYARGYQPIESVLHDMID
jgi:hypothetical protein